MRAGLDTGCIPLIREDAAYVIGAACGNRTRLIGLEGRGPPRVTNAALSGILA